MAREIPWDNGYFSAHDKRDIEKSVISGLITGVVVWLLINKGIRKASR